MSPISKRFRRTPNRVFDAITPFVRAVVAILSSFYTAFFAWWLDELIARRSDKKFAKDLECELATLISKRNLHVTANDRNEYQEKRSFDWAVVTLAGKEFRLRFVGVREELSIYVQPLNLKRGWENMETTLDRAVAPNPVGLQTCWATSDVLKAGQCLDQNWERLAEAMSEIANPQRAEGAA